MQTCGLNQALHISSRAGPKPAPCQESCPECVPSLRSYPVVDLLACCVTDLTHMPTSCMWSIIYRTWRYQANRSDISKRSKYIVAMSSFRSRHDTGLYYSSRLLQLAINAGHKRVSACWQQQCPQMNTCPPWTNYDQEDGASKHPRSE